jgi:hypothetical protein
MARKPVWRQISSTWWPRDFFSVGGALVNLERSKTGKVDIFVGLGVLTSTPERTLSQGGVSVNLGVRGTSGGRGFILGEFGVWT